MGKLRSAYLGKLRELESKVNEVVGDEDNLQMLRFTQLTKEAMVGKIQIDLIAEIGPVISGKVIKNLDPDFTFDDYIAGVDELFDKWKEKISD